MNNFLKIGASILGAAGAATAAYFGKKAYDNKKSKKAEAVETTEVQEESVPEKADK